MLISLCSLSHAGTVENNLDVNAKIEKFCIVDTSNINFGTVDLVENVYRPTTIEIRCNKNVNYKIIGQMPVVSDTGEPGILMEKTLASNNDKLWLGVYVPRDGGSFSGDTSSLDWFIDGGTHLGVASKPVTGIGTGTRTSHTVVLKLFSFSQTLKKIAPDTYSTMYSVNIEY